MSNVASSRGRRWRWPVLWIGGLAAGLLPGLPAADVPATPPTTVQSGGPADPESPGAAVIQPLESIVPDRKSTPAAQPLSTADARFLQHFRQSAQGRIDVGRLAMAEGLHPCVKKYAERLVEDHRRLVEEMDTLAASRYLSLSTALDAADRKLLAELQRLADASFDRRFADGTRRAQQRDFERVDQRSRQDGDKEIRSLAARTLPMLGEHLHMARDLATMVGGTVDSATPQGAPSPGCAVF